MFKKLWSQMQSSKESKIAVEAFANSFFFFGGGWGGAVSRCLATGQF